MRTQIILIFAFLILWLIPVQGNIHAATKPLSNQERIAKKIDFIKSKKAKFFQKRMNKRVAKKIKNQNLTNYANAVLSAGISGFLGSTHGIIFLSAPVFVIGFGLAILGTIFSGIVLAKILKRPQSENYQSNRKKAIWGLVLSSLGIIFPIAFVIILLSTINYE